MKKLLGLLAASLMLVGCSQADTAPTDTATPQATATAPTTGTPAEDVGPVVAFAAASLNVALPEITEDLDVQYSFDGSSGLLDQLVGGAPADVFASADENNMTKAVDAGLIEGDPIMFARNYLVLVVPDENPAGITGFNDTLEGAKLVICAPEVPCGNATARVAEAAGLALTPVSEEANVSDVLGKVQAGEADAGIVYATDAALAGDEVESFEIPGAEDDPNTYWIAALAEARNPEGAQAMIDQVMGPDGQSILAGYGFGPGE